MDNKKIDALIALLEGVKRGERLRAVDDWGEWVDQGVFTLLDNAAGDVFNPKEWRTVPQPKVIDLSCLVGSDVLCEFWNDDGRKEIGYLGEIKLENGITYGMCGRTEFHTYCRPATMVQACKELTHSKLSGVVWSWSQAQIDGEEFFIVKIFGTKEGYIWPHEVKK